MSAPDLDRMRAHLQHVDDDTWTVWIGTQRLITLPSKGAADDVCDRINAGRQPRLDRIAELEGGKLPHDVVVGHITYRKGVSLKTLTDAAARWFVKLQTAEARASTLQVDLEAVEAVLNHAGAPTHDGPDQGDSGPVAKLSMAGRVDALAAANERLARLGRAMEAERNSAVDRADALQGEVDGLREAVKRAEKWFLDYERQHRAKGTPEAELKADTNQERAAYLRAALSQDQGGR